MNDWVDPYLSLQTETTNKTETVSEGKPILKIKWAVLRVLTFLVGP